MLQGISKKAMTFTLNKKRITNHFFTSDILLKRERKAIYDSQFLFFFNMAGRLLRKYLIYTFFQN